MSDIQERNRETRIRQQKNTIIKRMIVCLVIIILFSVVFWAIMKSAECTEIS